MANSRGTLALCSISPTVAKLCVALYLLTVTAAGAEPTVCSADCQSQQGLALARLQAGLLGLGQSLQSVAGNLSDGTAVTLGTASVLPAHCLQTGMAVASAAVTVLCMAESLMGSSLVATLATPATRSCGCNEIQALQQHCT